jgi:hypothetical protein
MCLLAVLVPSLFFIDTHITIIAANKTPATPEPMVAAAIRRRFAVQNLNQN